MSYFRPNIDAIEGYTPGFQPREEGWTKLNTNENPYPPSPAVREALVGAAGTTLKKYPDPTGERFREVAAERLGTVPERIICGNGSDDLLTIAMRSFCGEGDAVAWPWPTYSLYPVLARIQGARPVEVEFSDDYTLPIDGLAEAGARLTLVCNPNAPSGTLTPPERVGELAAAIDGVVLVDEAYVNFADENCLRLVAEHGNVVVTRSMSKSYSLAGLRFGWAVAQEPLIEGMMKVKDSYNVDALALAGATAAMSDRDWMLRNVEKVRAGRARLSKGLERLGLRPWPSQTNFVLARAPEGRDAGDLYRRLFERKILVRYWDMPRLADCMRITVGSEEEISTLLGALEDILSQ